MGPGTGESGRIYGFGRLILFYSFLFFLKYDAELNLCTIYTQFYNRDNFQMLAIFLILKT